MAKRTVVLIRERVAEGEIYVDLYEYDTQHGKRPELALRAAAADFLATPEGKESIVFSRNDWNWGDLTSYLPPKILKRYGLKKIDQKPMLVEVDEDEVLIPKTPSMGIVLKDVP